MNYSEMKDKEIATAVALALGATIREFDSGRRKYRPSQDMLYPIGNVEDFDPCNSWADAGPIVEINRINLEFDGNETYAWGFANNYEVVFERHQSTRRAAMIVFLMMQEHKNE